MMPVSEVSGTPYQRLGGAEAVRALTERFYDLVESEPVAEPLRRLHLKGHGLAHARQAQFQFLSGFLGGPHLYFEQHHHADVRAMHSHVSIDTVARDAWLACMDMAIAQQQVAPDLAERLMASFQRVADRLVSA